MVRATKPARSTKSPNGSLRCRSDAHAANTGQDRDSAPPEREEVRQVLGVLDAVYLGEPGVLEARQRLTLRMRAAGHPQAQPR